MSRTRWPGLLRSRRRFGEGCETPDEACITAFVPAFPRLALRRTPSAAERDDALALAREFGGPDGLHAVVFTTLMGPDFLYRFENRGAAVADGFVQELTAFELATRLSWHFWGEPPDEQLRVAAERGELNSEAGYRAQVDRQFDDVRTDATLASSLSNGCTLNEVTSNRGLGSMCSRMACQWTDWPAKCKPKSRHCFTTTSNGEPCRREEECQSGFCTDNDRCAAPPEIGDSCSDFGNSCGSRAYCRNGSCAALVEPGGACDAILACKLPFVCQDGACRLPNLSCEPASTGQGCALFRVCDDDSWCDLVGGIVCRPRFRIGEECQNSLIQSIDVCEIGSRCMADESGTTRCVAQAAEGEPCDGVGGCVDGTYCVIGTCMGGDIGQPCDFDGDCPADLFCADREKVCLPPRAEGSECREHHHCAAGLYCDSTCLAQKRIGEECDETAECEASLYCDYLGIDATSTCQPDLPTGAECDSREEPCTDDAYCPPGITTCTVKVQNGEPCGRSRECVSGYCDGTRCLVSAMCVLPE